MKTGKTVLGIDEAGRGCAIGPMVVCGVLLDPQASAELKEAGVKDSKMLSPARRAQLAEKIREVAKGVFIEEIPPSEIQERNLNLLEIWRAARIISASGANRVYIDAPVGTAKGIKTFREHVKWCVGEPCPTIVAENRADATYVSVAAASIVAKVRRDSIIEELRHQFGDFGSGYPSDERTRRFLRDCHERDGGFPVCVRLRWKTVTRLTGPVQIVLPFRNEGV